MQNGSERNELLFCIVEVQPILLLNNKKHYNRTRHTGQYKIKNMRRLKNNHILCLLAVALCVVCIMSVYTPVNFDENRTKREQTVKLHLVQIRNAEERYRTLHGVYADNFAELIKSGLLADSLSYIPYSGGRRFDLTTTTTTGKSGRSVPLMECGAKYNDYLDGLDANSIANLIEQANNAGRYPGLKIGDLMTPNDNAGNWE